ncbi:MAG: hypothetical protein WAX77_08960 [Methylococcaceae bacterium]
MKAPLFALTLLALCSTNVLATEYIYRDLMANTLPSPACTTQQEASEIATKSYNLDKYSKRFCQSQGYGWHVEAVKDTGKVVCGECTGKSSANSNKKQCHVEDMVVTCKRIKPGSVGMLPGKG